MKSLIDDSVLTCDEIIDKVAKSYNDTPGTVTINSNHKMGYYILYTILLVSNHFVPRNR